MFLIFALFCLLLDPLPQAEPIFQLELKLANPGMKLHDKQEIKARLTSKVTAVYRIEVHIPESTQVISVTTSANFSVSLDGKLITYYTEVGPNHDFNSAIMVEAKVIDPQAVFSGIASNPITAAQSQASAIVQVMPYRFYVP